MANNQINSYSAANTIDPVNDLLLLYQASSNSYKSINRNTFLSVSGTPVDTSTTQTLTNKTLTSPTISGPTLSGSLTGTYTIAGTPTFPSSVVQLTSTQTLTNKTLTSPTINSPTITNASITADTISGFTTSNNGTIYGMSVTGGLLASAAIAGQVNTAALQTNAVGGSNLATSAITLGYAQITSPTTSTATQSWQNVGTLVQTVTVPAGGRRVKFTFCGICLMAGAGNAPALGLNLDGTVVQQMFVNVPNASNNTNMTFQYVSTPSAGSHTYQLVYAGNGSNGTLISAGSAGSTVYTAGPAFILVEAI